MKLKRLEIIGFKSFRDRIVIDFSTGISAVVGPNGCGKSNIVDAIRWVMGEQRVSLLRGKKMEDVIFNGSEDTAAREHGRGHDGHGGRRVFISGPLRRLLGGHDHTQGFRDEDGEYSINKVRCRLLDVREFFMDTGVGARTYSLVEQDSVATLIEAKPEERRKYIEEAAGITKYKSRKEAAVRKMESTRQNMPRLNDIFREVKSQLNSDIKAGQAGRAVQAFEERSA